MKKILLILLLPLCAVFSQEKKVMTYEDFIDLKRLDKVSVSPDGQWIVYNVRQYSLKSNTYTSNIFTMSVDGQVTKQLTFASTKDRTPAWAPDGRTIAFISNRGGEYQIFTIAIDGGEPKRITSISTQVTGDNLAWSPDGKFIAFTSDVFADCPDDNCNKEKNDARESGKIKAQVFDKLPFRVWDSFKEQSINYC